MMAKVKATFFVPLIDNDGRALDDEIDALEMELHVHFVGWTLLGYVRGGYQMADGTRRLDDSCSRGVAHRRTGRHSSRVQGEDAAGSHLPRDPALGRLSVRHLRNLTWWIEMRLNDRFGTLSNTK